MLILFLLLLFLLNSYASATTQTCVFEAGDIAIGYIPCDSTATSGNCCFQNEACLTSGLCYGAIGMIYRGACINEWGSGTCLTICPSSQWSNIVPCLDGQNSPQYFWCGDPAVSEPCSKTNGTVVQIQPGIVKNILPSIGALPTSTASPLTLSATSITSTTPSSIPTASTSTTLGTPSSQQTGLTSAANATCPKNEAKLAAVGAGVGSPLLLLAICMLVLFLHERRGRKADRAAATLPRAQIGENEHVSLQGYVTPLRYEMKQPEICHELPARKSVRELEGYHHFNDI